MGNHEAWRRSSHQVVAGHARALKDAEVLLLALAPPDAIQVKNSRVRGQAGPDSRVSVLSGPFEDLRETFPARLINKIHRHRLFARHDESIQVRFPELVYARILAADVVAAQCFLRDVKQGVERQANLDTFRRCIENGDELALSSCESSLRHVVDQSDR